MTDAATYTFLVGVAALWFTLLWLALRQPGRGNPKKDEHDQTRNP